MVENYMKHYALVSELIVRVTLNKARAFILEFIAHKGVCQHDKSQK